MHFLRSLRSVHENLLGFNGLTASFLHVIKIDLIIKQDGGRLVSFVLQYFRN